MFFDPYYIDLVLNISRNIFTTYRRTTPPFLIHSNRHIAASNFETGRLGTARHQAKMAVAFFWVSRYHNLPEWRVEAINLVEALVNEFYVHPIPVNPDNDFWVPSWIDKTTANYQTATSTFNDALPWCYDAFLLAYEETSNSKWDRAAKATHSAMVQQDKIGNILYWYRAEASTDPFRWPGSQVIGNTLSIVRVSNTSTFVALRNYLAVRTNIGEQVELRNAFVRDKFHPSNTIVEVNAGCATRTILTIEILRENDASPFQAFWTLQPADWGGKKEIAPIDFYRFTDQAYWYPTKYPNNYGATVNVSAGSVVHLVPVDITFITVKMVELALDLNAAASGYASVDLEVPLHTEPATIIYRTNGAGAVMNVSTADGSQTRTLNLPDTGNEFQVLPTTWASYSPVNAAQTGPLPSAIAKYSFATIFGKSVIVRVVAIFNGNSNVSFLEAFYDEQDFVRASIKWTAQDDEWMYLGNFLPKNKNGYIEQLPYTPGVLTQVVGAVYDETRGYKGSQGSAFNYFGLSLSNHWLRAASSTTGLERNQNLERFSNSIRFAQDSLEEYRNRSSSQIIGLPIPVFNIPYWFVPATLDLSVDYLVNVFSSKINNWEMETDIVYDNDYKKDQDWAGWVYRGFEAIARCLFYEADSNYEATNSDIVELVTKFLEFIDPQLEANGNIPPGTLSLESGLTTEDTSISLAALIGKVALFANVQNIDSVLTYNVLRKCYEHISTVLHIPSIPTEPLLTYAAWPEVLNSSDDFSEVVEFLAFLKLYEQNIKEPYEITYGIFPSAIAPREVHIIEPGEIPTIKNSFPDGTWQDIKVASTAVGTRLRFIYKKLNYQEVDTLRRFYDLTVGDIGWFIIDNESVLERGLIRDLAIAVNPVGKVWKFADPIKVDVLRTQVKPTTSRLYTCEFEVREAMPAF